jgi:hypothetical protein
LPFFSKRTDDETTILVVYDIYIINQLPKMTIIKTNKQKTNKLKTNKKQKSKNKQTKPIKKKEKKSSIEIVHKGLLHMYLSK